MSDTAEIQNPEELKLPLPKKKKSAPRRIVRVLTYLGALFLLMLIILVIATETAFFRSWLRDTVIDLANDNLNATLHIGELHGNILTGFVLSNVSLTTSMGELISFHSVAARYNILRLPFQSVQISEISLNDARVTLLRDRNGRWNFENLSKDTSSSKGGGLGAWKLAFMNVRLNNARITVFDSANQMNDHGDRFSTADLEIVNLNLALDAFISDAEKKFHFNQLQFQAAPGHFQLRNFAGDILLKKNSLDVEKLSIQTHRSSLQLDASVHEIDLFGAFDFEEFASKPIALQLDAAAIDLRDLQYFLPALDLLGGTHAITVTADGSLQHLVIKKMLLTTPKSEIAFTGVVQDIDKGVDLIIDVSSESTTIDPSELPDILPGIPLPDYSAVGIVRCSALRFNGKPLLFDAEIDMNSDAADAKGNLRLDITGSELAYKSSITVQHADLSKILLNPKLKSSINLIAELQGVGVTPGTMQGSMRAYVDSSFIATDALHHVEFEASATLHDLQLKINSASGESYLTLEAKCGYERDSVTSFHITADAHALNLSTIVGSEIGLNPLSFQLAAEGDGLDINRSSLDVNLAVSNSNFRAMEIEADSVSLHVDQRDPKQKSILIETKYVDAALRGEFQLPRFFDLSSTVFDSLMRSVKSLIGGKDSTQSNQESLQQKSQKHSIVAGGKQNNVRDTLPFMHASYSVRLKRPELAAKYLNADVLFARGSLSGTINGGWGGLSINGTLVAPEIFFIDSSVSLRASDLRAQFSLQKLQLERALEDVHLKASVQAKKIFQDRDTIGVPKVSIEYADQKLYVASSASIDTSSSFDVEAIVSRRDQQYEIMLPKLDVNYFGSRWRNIGAIQVSLDTGMVSIEECVIGKDAINFRVHGKRTFEGMNTFKVYATNVQLRDVEYMLTQNTSSLQGSGFSGIASLEAEINGSDPEPLIASEILIDSLSYKRQPIGQLRLEGRYEKKKLEIYSEMFYRMDTGSQKKILFISGMMPFELAFRSHPVNIPDERANLRIRLTDFPLSLIEKSVGIFSQLDGSANANIQVSGTAERPEYDGQLSIRQARGIFKFNNMPYIMSAEIEPKKNAIVINQVTIANDRQDWKDGSLQASGKIDIENFGIKQFWVTTKGQLKVLRNASRSATKSIYGDLYIITGDEGLSYSGRLDRSRLNGKASILEGNLVFPPEGGGGGAEKNTNISYVVIDDTTKKKSAEIPAFGMRTENGKNGKITEEETSGASTSFLDGLAYDITLSTQGITRIVMPFSNLTQEELNAQLQLEDFRIHNFGGHGKFEGQIELTGDSYYLFFGKKFRASGKLIFIGMPQNPDLDLMAVYEGTRIDPTTKESRRVYVILKITGTKSKPNVTFDIRQDAVDGPRAQVGDVQSDALSFIITGSFTNDLTTQEKGKLLEKAQGLSNTLASSLLSTAMSGFLQKTGLDAVVNRIEISGLGSTDTRLKVSKEIGRAIITYDGKITDLGASDIKAEIPIGQILQTPILRNMMLEISRKSVSTSIETGVTSQENAIYELKLFYRFSF